MMEWINEFLYVPYKVNGRDENGMDCYGLVIAIYERMGITLPDYLPTNNVYAISATIRNALDANSHIAQVVDVPAQFDMVVIEHNQYLKHIGIYLNGRVLHTSRATKHSVLESVQAMKMKGMGHLTYYRYVGIK